MNNTIPPSDEQTWEAMQPVGKEFGSQSWLDDPLENTQCVRVPEGKTPSGNYKAQVAINGWIKLDPEIVERSLRERAEKVGDIEIRDVNGELQWREKV